MSTHIKICGITSVHDLGFVVRAGADAIGLVFAGGPRRIGIARAREIVAATPEPVKTVALFMNTPREEITRVLQEVPVHLLQFHGQEPADQCRCWGLPYVKALSMTRGRPADVAAREYHDARAYLLDAHQPGQAGGTGRVFDWKLVPEDMPGPVILAGGLNAENVGAAIHQVAPWAVDVSSGVECSPGVKDEKRVTAFVAAVRKADGRSD